MKKKIYILGYIISISAMIAINIADLEIIEILFNWAIISFLFMVLLRLDREKTALVKLNKQLQEEEEKYNVAVEGTRDIIFQWNIIKDEVDFSERINEIIKLNNKSVLSYSKDWLSIIHEEDKVRAKKLLSDKIQDENVDYYETEYRIVNHENVIKWLNIKSKIIRDETGKATWIYGSISDSTDAKEKELKISYMSYYDSVTGLHNRNYLKALINKSVKENKVTSSKAALILIDLDNFKYINDVFGHDYGDDMLMIIADALRDVVSARGDLVCRFGGDEFVIFMQDIDNIKEVERTAQQIITVFNNTKKLMDQMIFTTASIGITVFPDDASDYKSLLRNADVAMYKAKGNGKNSYQFFDDQISREQNRFYTLEKGLRNALENRELYVQFQPKVVLDDAKIMGFEALIRWNNKDLGMVSPAEFIPVAENTRLIIPIGSFVIEEVCKKCKDLLEKGHDDFKLALNLSEIQLRDDNIIESFRKLTEKYNIDPKYIEIEITESLLMKSFDRNIKILAFLRGLGFSIALDDFGTGYSSLNYLTKLPIDVLKIDRSFVSELGDNQKSQYIVENIIQLSHKLGIKVVAEGVEYKDQVDYLKSIFCDFVQGYYYSKPESYEKIVKLMEERYIVA
ncbi:GGDEF and EAL domain-containing protein [Clostridium sp. C8-1-8]|uniref:putative bifunctional diguanylate cyclase/phosphodiesterase n=1 Tax=Clostridium sp. C8-1-8 TaxID=2698831 RepID=UPI00137048B6|nr:GGDEF and EAL domain-containing protein [Clostridium sp. C8-1-8]